MDSTILYVCVCSKMSLRLLHTLSSILFRSTTIDTIFFIQQFFFSSLFYVRRE